MVNIEKFWIIIIGYVSILDIALSIKRIFFMFHTEELPKNWMLWNPSFYWTRVLQIPPLEQFFGIRI